MGNGILRHPKWGLQMHSTRDSNTGAICDDVQYMYVFGMIPVPTLPQNGFGHGSRSFYHHLELTDSFLN